MIRGYVAVVGPSGRLDPTLADAAVETGRLLAEAGCVVVTGGGSGVMEAACRGARSAGGTTVGILPGHDRREGNDHLSVALPTGLGELRNGLLVRAADVVVAVGGSWGSLSEIALARRTGVPVYALAGWDLAAVAEDGPVVVTDPAGAVSRVLSHLR